LARVAQIRERTHDKLAVFSGNGVRTMIDEMRLGFWVHCPTVELSDFFAAAFDLWHGRRREAFDMFGRIQAFGSITGSHDYLMVVRGVFKETTKTRGARSPVRRRPEEAVAAAGGPLDEATKQAVREAWDQYMKPYLRG